MLRRWSCAQPGVDDEEIKQLVEDKVDAFWKGVEGDANKRGQVRLTVWAAGCCLVWFLRN